MTQSKKYQIQTNQELFSAWMSYGKEFVCVADVIQNDMELSTEQLNEWFISTNTFLRKKQQHLTPQQMKHLLELRNQTIQHIKSINN